MRKLLFIGALFLLGACASTVPGQSPTGRVYAAQADYNVLLAAAVRYNELPRCEQPAAPSLCSKASAVAEIRKADTAADAALKMAQAYVRSRSATASTVDSSIAAALQAVGSLRTVLAAYGIN